MKKLIICSNTKEILFSLIEFFSNENSVLIVRSYSGRVSNEILLNLNKLKEIYPRRVILHHSMPHPNDFIMKVKTIIINRLLYFLFLFFLFFRFFGVKKEVYFFCESIVYDILKFNSSNYLMEHGGSTYLDLSKVWKGDQLLFSTFSGGRSKYVKEIWLQKPRLAAEDVRGKVRHYDPKSKFGNLSSEQKETINSIFNIPTDIDFDTVIVTENFSEAGYCTEEEKVSMYLDVIEKYKIKDIVIKTHPAESTDYRTYFDCFVIDKFIPFELFEFNDVFFRDVYTITSSVNMMHSNNTRVHYLGAKFNEIIYSEMLKRHPADIEKTLS